MKIAILGASGMAGSAVYKQAAARGHEVTGFVRDAAKAKAVLGEGANLAVKNDFDLQKQDLAGFDVVVNAFSAPPDKAYLHVDLAAKLVALFRESESPRLFFILGAGSLLDANDVPFVETIKKMPGAEAWLGIPVNQYKELEFLRNVDNVNWVGASPSATFEAGEAHTPVLGKDHLLTAAGGESHTTSGTMAVAILNEIEHPSVFKSRFTVSD
ncbi:MAG: NAD(P)H-binding protein [Oscillospiraceae bacterium]